MFKALGIVGALALAGCASAPNTGWNSFVDRCLDLTARTGNDWCSPTLDALDRVEERAQQEEEINQLNYIGNMLAIAH